MSDDSNSKLVEILLKFRAFLISKDVLTFSLFLLLSASFWFINWLNKEQEFFVTLPVSYENLPKNIVLQNKLPDELQVKVRELGMRYWLYLRKKPEPIAISFQTENNRNGRFRVTNFELLSKVSNNLMASSTVLSVNPETINIHFQTLTEKRLPIVSHIQLDLDAQFMLCSSLELKPDSIDVYGPASVLDTLEKVHTEHVTIANKQDTLFAQVKLQSTPALSYSTDIITASASVDKFTEKTVVLPVQVINTPIGLTAMTFPAEVQAVFNIAFKNYKDFHQDDIRIILDYNEIKQESHKKNSLQIINYKPYIANIRIQPEEVEIVLEEL